METTTNKNFFSVLQYISIVIWIIFSIAWINFFLYWSQDLTPEPILVKEIIETDNTASKTINNAMNYSCPYQNPMYIIINNKLKDKVSLYWVDRNGTELFYAELNPNGTSTLCSGIGAFFRWRDMTVDRTILQDILISKDKYIYYIGE